jgi:hypothetical protein
MAGTFISNYRANLRHVKVTRPRELVTNDALERI